MRTVNNVDSWHTFFAHPKSWTQTSTPRTVLIHRDKGINWINAVYSNITLKKNALDRIVADNQTGHKYIPLWNSLTRSLETCNGKYRQYTTVVCLHTDFRVLKLSAVIYPKSKSIYRDAPNGMALWPAFNMSRINGYIMHLIRVVLWMWINVVLRDWQPQYTTDT